MDIYQVQAETAQALSSWLILANSPEEAMRKFNKHTVGSINAVSAHKFFLGDNEPLKIATYLKP